MAIAIFYVLYVQNTSSMKPHLLVKTHVDSLKKCLPYPSKEPETVCIEGVSFPTSYWCVNSDV